MKKMKITGLAFLSLLIGTNVFGQSGSSELLTVPLSSPGKPYSLKVQLMMGSIKVRGYDGKEIIINATPGNSDEEKPKVADKGMKKISTPGYEVTAKEADNTVTVNAGNFSKTVDLDLKIPQDVKLKIGTVNNGEIIADNVKGELEISNVNGNITLTSISGSVVANTVNGSIIVTFNSVDPKAPMAFSTFIGDVNVTLPSDTKANLKLKSDRGEVFTDFDINIDKTPSNADKTTEPGMYKITKDDWINGKINGGGPEIIMKNMHGNIYVKKAGK